EAQASAAHGAAIAGLHQHERPLAPALILEPCVAVGLRRRRHLEPRCAGRSGTRPRIRGRIEGGRREAPEAHQAIDPVRARLSRPGAGADHVAAPAVARGEDIEQRRQEDHVAHPAEPDHDRVQRGRRHDSSPRAEAHKLFGAGRRWQASRKSPMRAFAWFLGLCAAALFGVAVFAYPAWALLYPHFNFPFHRVGERIGMLALLIGFLALARYLGLADRSSLGYGLPRRAFLRETSLAVALGVAS